MKNIRRNSKCPKCEGKGYWPDCGSGYFKWSKCLRCKGLGRVKLSIGERTEPRKYKDIIQPVRNLAIENSGLRNTLRSVTKKYAKCRYKRNKHAKQIKKQGQYIQCLKAQLKELST